MVTVSIGCPKLRNNEWWREFSHFVYRASPNAILVGEVLGDAEMLRRHAWGLDRLLDEPFMNEVRSEVGRPGPGFVGRRKQFIEQARVVNRMAYDAALPFADQAFEPWPFVGSHDRNPRLASDLEEMKRRGMPLSVDEGYRLALVRGLSNLRTRHPSFANGEIGAILSDSADWIVFERVRGSDHYLVLINPTSTGKDYRFHPAWFPQFRGADLVFWSDGQARKWKDLTADAQRIGDSVFVPAVGLVVIRQRS